MHVTELLGVATAGLAIYQHMGVIHALAFLLKRGLPFDMALDLLESWDLAVERITT